jgi:hypothetical protein
MLWMGRPKQNQRPHLSKPTGGQKKTFLDFLRLFGTDDKPNSSAEYKTAFKASLTRRGGEDRV